MATDNRYGLIENLEKPLSEILVKAETKVPRLSGSGSRLDKHRDGNFLGEQRHLYYQKLRVGHLHTIQMLVKWFLKLWHKHLSVANKIKRNDRSFLAWTMQ